MCFHCVDALQNGGTTSAVARRDDGVGPLLASGVISIYHDSRYVADSVERIGKRW